MRKIKDGLPLHVIPNPAEALSHGRVTSPSDGPWMQHPCIMTVGRLVPFKRQDLLMESFSTLSEVYHLVIFREGPERARLIKKAEDLKIANRVWLLGQVLNPREQFAFARACLVSSDFEGFPNVLLEMMSVNWAVVSTICADGIDQLPGIFTCFTGNSTQLAMAIQNALDMSDTDREIRFRQMKDHLSEKTYG